MTKGGALALAIACAVLMLVFYAANIPMCGTVFLVVLCIPGSIWFSKFSRDQNLANANRARQQLPAAQPQIAQTEPRSHGVSKLFVPDPLGRER